MARAVLACLAMWVGSVAYAQEWGAVLGEESDVNYPPVADPREITLTSLGPVHLELTGTDEDGDQLIYSIIGHPTSGAVSSFDPILGLVVYDPGGVLAAFDSLEFVVDDGAIDSGKATITFWADRDSDGVRDSDEEAIGTDPVDPDSDDDGLLDGVESGTGVFDSLADTGTDPLVDDSDGDGISDGSEAFGGSDPLNPASFPPPTPIPSLGWIATLLFALVLVVLSLRQAQLPQARQGG